MMQMAEEARQTDGGEERASHRAVPAFEKLGENRELIVGRIRGVWDDLMITDDKKSTSSGDECVNFWKYLGSALMVVRVQRSISQEALAALLTKAVGEKVTQGYISKVEKGHTRISWERMGLLCELLECRPSRLVALSEFLAEQELRPDREVIADLLAVTRKKKR
jgi:transcriptional regulator with XRE-family HTH domain